MVALVGIVLTLTTWLAARRVDGLPATGANGRARHLRSGRVAQIPLGGITVLLDLHPLAVMSHFLLALRRARRRGRRRARGLEPARAGLRRRSGPRWLRAVAAVGSPPARCSSSPARSRPRRGRIRAARTSDGSGSAITDTVYVHVRAAAVFGIGFLVVGFFLWRAPARAAGDRARRGLVCSSCSSRQMVVGEVQYRNALPWWLVARPRLAGGDDLDAHGRARVLALAASSPRRCVRRAAAPRRPRRRGQS